MFLLGLTFWKAFWHSRKFHRTLRSFLRPFLFLSLLVGRWLFARYPRLMNRPQNAHALQVLGQHHLKVGQNRRLTSCREAANNQILKRAWWVKNNWFAWRANQWPLEGEDAVHMSFTLKLNANFCELKKEGHFHYKNFLRALKWVPTW